MAPLFSEIYLKGVRLLDLGLISVELLAAEQEFPSPCVSGQVGAGVVQSHPQCALLFLLQSQLVCPGLEAVGTTTYPLQGSKQERGVCVYRTSQSAQGTGAEQKGLSPLQTPGEQLSPAGVPLAIGQRQCKASCAFWVLEVPQKKGNSCPTFITTVSR